MGRSDGDTGTGPASSGQRPRAFPNRELKGFGIDQLGGADVGLLREQGMFLQLGAQDRQIHAVQLHQ